MRTRQTFKRRGYSQTSNSLERKVPAPCIEPLENRRMMSVSITRNVDNTLMADATWESYDSTGSILTDVQINVTKSLASTNGETTQNDTVAAITLSVANENAGFFIVASEAPAVSQNFAIDPNLRTAHLVASFDLTDLNGQAYFAYANLTWHATDSVQKNVTRSLSFNGPGITNFSKTVGDAADAIATGTVTTTATQTSPAIANATPNSSNQADLQKNLSGETTITVTIPPKWKFFFPSFGTNSILLDASDALSKLTGM